MNQQCTLVSIAVFIIYSSASNGSNVSTIELTQKLQFPKQFILGVGSEAFPIDRSSNKNGIEGIIDFYQYNLLHNGTKETTSGSASQTFRKEIETIKSNGFSLFQFSLNWSWILPNGTTDQVNYNGLKYYKDLVSEMVDNNIETMVILYGKNLPQRLQNIGGWLNPLVVERFEQYARLMFQNLGPKVKWWLTINEPSEIAESYGTSKSPPALNLHGFGEYVAGHNLLRAHARVYRMYKKEFTSSQKGKISMNLKSDFVSPADDSEEGQRAAETALQFSVGWFGHPVYSVAGDYPAVMRDYIDRNSAIEGLKKSRLPYFTREEMHEIRGSFDFLAVTHSTCQFAAFSQGGPRPSWRRDSGVKLFFRQSGSTDSTNQQNIAPDSLKRMLTWLREEYGNIPIFVSEGDHYNGQRLDDNGKTYYNERLSEVMRSIKEDDCSIIGYCMRSLMGKV